MKFLTSLFAILVLSVSAARADESAGTQTAPVAPAQTPAQTTPAPVAKEPEDDTKPGALKSRLDAFMATITGKHANPATVEARDATITSLTAQLAAVTGENTTLSARIITLENALKSQEEEAKQYLASIVQGNAAAASTPLQKTITEAAQAGAAKVVRAVGVPQDNLEQPAAPKAAITGTVTPLTDSQKAAACRAAWEGAGYQFPGRN